VFPEAKLLGRGLAGLHNEPQAASSHADPADEKWCWGSWLFHPTLLKARCWISAAVYTLIPLGGAGQNSF